MGECAILSPGEQIYIFKKFFYAWVSTRLSERYADVGASSVSNL